MRDRLPSLKTPNLKSQVYDLLLNMIVDGKYSDNDMLPPERVLCEELGVSRTVVREAVKSLETRGILQVIHGKGIKVNASNSSDVANAFMLYLKRKKSMFSMKDLLEARYSIETEITKYAAIRATKDDIVILENKLNEMKEARDDVERFIIDDLDYHLQLAKITNNIFFITIMEALLIPMRKSRKETVSVQDNLQSFEEHVGIFKCIKNHDSKKAKELMAAHLEHVEKVLEDHHRL